MLALITLFLASFAGIFGYFLHEGTQQTSRQLQERSGAAAQVVETNAAWISEVAHQTLQRVDMAIGPMLSADEDIVPAIGNLPNLTQLSIVDRNGKPLVSTLDTVSEESVVDRQYFTALRNGEAFYISSLLTSRARNEDIFVFSKRIERSGNFIGAAIVSFPVSILSTFWESLDLPPGSTIGLFRTDGKLIARFPPTDGELDLSEHPLFTEYLPSAPVGTYHSAASPVDGVARVVSYRQIPDTEIVAVASVAADETWARFRSAIAAVGLIVLPIFLCLVAGLIWILRLLMRDAQRKRELEAALDANKLLFREIHHRVKNNLQSVQSLVALQNLPPEAKRDMGARLAAMAAMHEHIYQADRFAEIDAHEYVPVIMDEAVQAYGRKCSLHYDLDHVQIDRDHATPLALLLSELATNACKYAFSDGREGRIDVSLKASGPGRADITVSDNGVGLSDTRKAGMGTRLLKGLASQMAGTYTLTSNGGTHFKANLALETVGHSRRDNEVAAAADEPET